MVATRKQPVAPALSRSSSTQPIATSATPKKLIKNATKSINQNGHDTNSHKGFVPPSVKPSKHKPKKRSGTSFLDRLFILSLSLFTFYTFYTCRPNPLFSSSPSDAFAHDPNALCRSLATYRTRILDPYVLPPLQYTLLKTQSITEPYVSQAQSHLEPYIAPVLSTAKTLRPHVDRATSTAQRIWKKSLVPFYQKTLKPYWKSAILPRYNKFIEPQLVPLKKHALRSYRYYIANPLRIQSLKAQIYFHTTYAKYVAPYVNKFQPHIKQAIDTVYVMSVKGIDIYQEHVHPRVLAAWKVARPVLCKFWKLAKKYLLVATDIARNQLQVALKGLGRLRRTYVDPHIIRIWDKVVEGTETVSTSTFSTTSSSQTFSIEAVEPTSESIEAPTASIANAYETATTVAIPVTTAAPVESEQAEDLPSPEEAAEDAATAPGIHAGSHTAVPPPIEAEEQEVAQVILEAPKEVVPGVEETHVPVAAAAEIVVEVEVPPSPIEAPAPVTERDSDAIAPNPSETETEESITDILAELGLDDDESQTSTVSTPAAGETSEVDVPGLKPLTPEEIAAKRLDIITRHDNWFVKLYDTVDEETPVLAQALLDLRNEKVKELDVLRQNGAVDDVQKDGEKLLRGLDGYLHKAQSRKATWRLVGDEDTAVDAKKGAAKKEKEKWGKILAKVEDKFTERVRKMQSDVHVWYLAVREKENQEINNSVYRVKNVAERAQADIGLDYAWLEDVTYHDWQKYHDLARIAEAYQETAYAMQNGTDPDAPNDPVVTDLNLLDGELQDVILGFQVALGSTKSEATKLFNTREIAEDDDDSGFFVVKDGQVRKDDFRGVDLDQLDVKKKEGAGIVEVHKDEASPEAVTTPEDSGEVHILPIVPVAPPSEEEENAGFDASKIIIGKDPVSIEQVLKDIPVESSSADSHDEL